MKKIYLSPSIKIASANFKAILITESVPNKGQASSDEIVDAKQRADLDADGKGFYEGYNKW